MKKVCKIFEIINDNLGSFFGGMALGSSIYGWAGMAIGGIFGLGVIFYTKK